MASPPGFLCHYYEAARGPFRTLSDLPPDAGEAVLDRIRRAGLVFASRRAPEYLQVRRGLEERIRNLFEAKGGRPLRRAPHYLVLGENEWLRAWYERGAVVRVPIAAIDPATVSFTYGDSFPAMRYQDGKPYRGQVFTLEELPDLVAQYGLPQEWNPDGKLGPDRYIEAQLWAEPAHEWLPGPDPS